MEKAAFKEKTTPLTCKMDLIFRNKQLKCYTWNTALCGAKAWTLGELDQKYLGSFEMWCWRRMETICWTSVGVKKYCKSEGGQYYPTENKKKED